MPWTKEQRKAKYAERQAARWLGQHVACACGCGEMIPAITAGGNPATYKHGHNSAGKDTQFAPGHDRGAIGVEARRQRGMLYGPGHQNWKGGEFTFKSGHVRATITPEQAAIWPTSWGGHGGYHIMRSHKVWNEAYPGSVVQKGENIHHVNRIRDDDRIDNLQKMSVRDHQQLHNATRQRTNGRYD